MVVCIREYIGGKEVVAVVREQDIGVIIKWYIWFIDYTIVILTTASSFQFSS